MHLPFAVSIAAQAAALASLAAEDQLLAQVAQVVAAREPLRRALVAQGWDVPPAQGNFVWLAAGADSDRVSQVFEDHGVLVRCFSGEGLRITVSDEQDNALVLVAAQAARP